jgi:ADP-ribose pyrophosphatase
MSPPPIRLVNRRLGCTNRMFEVFLDDIADQRGETVFNFVVVSPRWKAENQVAGIAILPIFEGTLGLLRIYRHPVAAYTWEVPRGFIDAGEEASTAALRELEEETGLQCDRQDLVDLGTMLPEPGVLAARTRLFVASRCRLVTCYRPSELGHKELRFFSVDEVAGMANKGDIEDGHTLVVFYRYHHFPINH